MMDDRIPVYVDKEEFEVIKMMVKKADAHLNLGKGVEVIRELVLQGYKVGRASELVVLARGELLKNKG